MIKGSPCSGLEPLQVRLLQKGEWGGVFPFDGCVFTFFWCLVSIIYGTWYLVLCFWLMVIGKGYVVRADGGR